MIQYEIRIDKAWKREQAEIAKHEVENPGSARWTSPSELYKYKLYRGGCTVGMINIGDTSDSAVESIMKNLNILNTRKGANRAAKLLAYRSICSLKSCMCSEISSINEWANSHFNIIDVIATEYRDVVCSK